MCPSEDPRCSIAFSSRLRPGEKDISAAPHVQLRREMRKHHPQLLVPVLFHRSVRSVTSRNFPNARRKTLPTLHFHQKSTDSVTFIQQSIRNSIASSNSPTPLSGSRLRRNRLNCLMKTNSADSEDYLARLAQEATNQSTPEKSLREQSRRIPRRKIAPKRTKAPDA